MFSFYNFIFNPLEQFEINNYILYNYIILKTYLFISINILKNNIFLKKYYFLEFLNNNFFFFKDYSLFLELRNFIKGPIYFHYHYILFKLYLIINFIFNAIWTCIPTNDFFLILLFLSLLLFLFIFKNFNFKIYFHNILNFFLITLIRLIISIVESISNLLIKYSLYLLTIFFFILLLNLLGLMPYVKSFTSTLSINFFLAITSFFSLTLEGLLYQKLQFFSRFAPSNVPFAILPGLVLIELISYFMRPNSLAIRLFSNMLAGHILIKLFISFCLILGSKSLLSFLSCFYFIGVLMLLEVFISFLQAYIFMLLILLYLDDILHTVH